MFALLAIAAVVVVVAKPELAAELRLELARAYDKLRGKPCCADCQDGKGNCGDATSGSGLPPAAPGESDTPPGALADLDPDLARFEDEAVAISNIRAVEKDPWGGSLGATAKDSGDGDPGGWS